MRRLVQAVTRFVARSGALSGAAACCVAVITVNAVAQTAPAPAPAQTPIPRPLGGGAPDVKPQADPDALAPTPADSDRRRTTESVEADVSTRSVAVTSGFTGSEIIVFGTVIDSAQEAAEAGLYDVIITLDGTGQPIVARKKSWVAGIWINTQSVTFNDLPSYYAISSTRPINEIAPAQVLREKNIGFTYIFDEDEASPQGSKPEPATEDFKASVVRLKTAQDLYQSKPYGVAFIGKSLFRSSIKLPANVPVGALKAQVYLFRDGRLLSEYTASVSLQREGLERWLHDLAFNQPLLYGVLAVILAVFAGLAASFLFPRRSS